MVPNENRTKLSLDVPETITIGKYADEDTPPMPEPELTGDDQFFVRIVVKYRGPSHRVMRPRLVGDGRA
jgi:hypothetical protein